MLRLGDVRFSFLIGFSFVAYTSCIACFFMFIAFAQAQSTDSDPQRRYDAALEAVMENMADPEKSFKFVEAASELGDLRGAISALERILLINPNLPNIKLELGVLYLRIGSPDLAKTFIQRSLVACDVVLHRLDLVAEPAQGPVDRLAVVFEVFVGRREIDRGHGR